MPKKTKKLGAEKKQKLVKHILELKKEAADATRDRRLVWAELWQLFQNKQDASRKQAWQSKVFIPKVFMAILRASSLIKQAVLQAPKLFKFLLDDDGFEKKLGLQSGNEEADQKLEQAKAEERKRLLKSEKKFKRYLGKSNFVNAYSEMIEVAFLLGLGCIKEVWEGGKLIFQNIEVAKIFIDPDYRPFQDDKPGYIIEEDEKSLTALKKLAKDVNKQAKAGGKPAIYDMSEIKNIEEDWKKLSEAAEERRSKGLSDYKKVNKRISLLLYWGDVIDDDTGDIDEDQFLVIANEKYLIRRQPNPFASKRPPYILTFPIVYPHRGISGISLVEPMVKINYAYNNILNMYIDNLNFTVNKMYEVNTNNLSNPQSLGLIYPGKLIKKTSDLPAMTEVFKTPVSDDALKALNILDQEVQAGTAVTEFVSGISGKTKTKAEFEGKVAASQGLFDVIGRDIERNSIKPALEMARDILIQYSDLAKDLDGEYDIQVGGVSLLLIQEKMQQWIGQVLAIALQNPHAQAMTDIGELWFRFLTVLNLQDVYIDPEETGGKNIEAVAQQKAKEAVGEMSDKEIMEAQVG